MTIPFKINLADAQVRFASSGVLGAQVALHATLVMALSLTPPWHSSSLIPGHFGSSDR